jgi:hypothetical protein
MTPQEQKELLLTVVVRVAVIQLKIGGLFPFGATLGSKRDVKLLTPKSMKKNVSREELDEYWKRELRKSTAEDECKTACWCADVLVPMDDGSLVPAIFVNFEHADGSAEDILYPYRKTEGSDVVLDVPTSATTEHKIFSPS